MSTALRAAATAAILLLTSGSGQAQTPMGTAFTYQGRCVDAGTPANGSYDLRFTLFAADSGGAPVGTPLVKDDVPVANGLFAVTLDFGAGAFAGSGRWLEIGVRPGPSGGAFTTLTPRQVLNPAPHSLFSANAATIAGLACANGQVAKWGAGGWSCGSDVDTNSGGTVTTVATGAGLTGGPISGSGTVAVATGGISSAMIANGAVGTAQVNPAQVQVRVGGACILGHYLRGINADGTVLCEPLPIPTVVTTIENASPFAQGIATSIAVLPDGRPVISFRGDGSTFVPRSLRVLRCGNAACTTGNSLAANVFLSNGLGDYTSIAIGSDGLPVVGFYDQAALKVVKCGTAECDSGNVVTTLDNPANDVGSHVDIAVPADGRPVLSYHDTAGALKFARCGNPSCSAGNFNTLVDGLFTTVGDYTSIAIGADGLPIISYHGIAAGSLKVVKCGNASCSAGNTFATLDDPANDVGGYTSIAIAPDGLPVISYHGFTAGTLKVAKCGNAACTGLNSLLVVDNPANGNVVGAYSSIAIGSDGLPVVGYQDATAGALKVAHCGNAACSAGNTITTVDFGSYTSLAVGADGLPVLSYHSADTLRVVKCGSATCR